MGASTPMPPRNRPAAGAATGGGQPNSRTSQQPHGSSLRSTRSAQREAHAPARWCRAQRWSEGMLVVLLPSPSVCAEEHSGQRIRTRDCLSAVKRSEFERDPAGREHRRLPEAQRRDADSGVAFFCLLFLATQEKKVRRRAHIPAPALGTSKPPDQRASPARTGERCRTQSLSIQ